MPIKAMHVLDTLDAYLTRHPEDKDALAIIREMLDVVGNRITSRNEFRGHVTAGAVLLRPDGRVLTLHHKALGGKWLCPGGHVEPDDTTLLAAALRDLVDKTGIDPSQVERHDEVPLHIDVRPIPANVANAEPTHLHFDFRFLLRTSAESFKVEEQEFTAYSWQFADTLTAEPLRGRVLASIQPSD